MTHNSKAVIGHTRALKRASYTVAGYLPTTGRTGIISASSYSLNRLVSLIVKTLLSVRKVRSSSSGSVKLDTVSPTARHPCDVQMLCKFYGQS